MQAFKTADNHHIWVHQSHWNPDEPQHGQHTNGGVPTWIRMHDNLVWFRANEKSTYKVKSYIESHSALEVKLRYKEQTSRLMILLSLLLRGKLFAL